MITFKVTTNKALEKELRKKLENAAESELQIVGQLALTELELVTPVDTGLAADSWDLSFEGNKLELTNKQDYVKYLNAGSSKQAPANFIEQVLLSYGTPKGPIVTYD